MDRKNTKGATVPPPRGRSRGYTTPLLPQQVPSTNAPKPQMSGPRPVCPKTSSTGQTVSVQPKHGPSKRDVRKRVLNY